MPVDYQQYIQQAQKRYLQSIYGAGGAEGFVGSQVRGVASATQPYFQQASRQGASGVSARGGAGGGAADSLQSQLLGQRQGLLTQAGSKAEGDVLNTKLATLGLGQREAGLVSADERARLQREFQQAFFEWQKQQANRQFRTDAVGDLGALGFIL